MSEVKKTREEIVKETLDFITPIVEKYSYVAKRADEKEIELELNNINNIMEDTTISYTCRANKSMVSVAVLAIMSDIIENKKN